MLRFLCILIITSAHAFSCASAGDVLLPKDVASFKERRDACDYFRGEPMPEERATNLTSEERKADKERRDFLIQQIDRYCSGADKQLRMLKMKYKDNAAALKLLNVYDANIEADD